MKIHKNYVAIHLSAEEVYWHRSLRDSRYCRRVERVIVTNPSEADWAEYRKAKEAHEYLLDSPYFEDGGPDERSTVNEPQTRRECVYAETIEQWIARCHELEQDGAE